MGLLVTLSDEVSAQVTDSDAVISIGLLVNEMNEEQAINTAKKVIKRINESGGVQGKKLKLESRLVQGAWGAGSSQIVDLVFKDKVAGIIGALDGRNAHLAEQVIAKTQVLYVSAWASDPTLSKAYVSWYFTVVPTDDQQAKLLADAIHHENNGASRILVLLDDTYDAHKSLKSFRAAIAEHHTMNSQIMEISHSDSESEWLGKIADTEMDAVVVLGSTLPILKINKALHGNYKETPLMYLNVAATGSSEFDALRSRKPRNIRCISKHLEENSKDSEYRSGVEGYVEDGIMALINSLQNSQSDFSNAREVMSKINFQGVTGQIEFDALGRLKKAENRLRISLPF